MNDVTDWKELRSASILEHMLGENTVESHIREWERAPEVHQVMHIGVVKPVDVHPVWRVEPPWAAAEV